RPRTGERFAHVVMGWRWGSEYVAEQPVQDDEDEDGADATATQLAGAPAGEAAPGHVTHMVSRCTGGGALERPRRSGDEPPGPVEGARVGGGEPDEEGDHRYHHEASDGHRHAAPFGARGENLVVRIVDGGPVVHGASLRCSAPCGRKHS